MELILNDGGRRAAGFKGEARDCFCRALSIATGSDYREMYDLINEMGGDARNGVHVEVAHKVMKHLGWSWTATMHIGQGCTVHLRASELPSGPIITRLSRHYAAVIDRVVHDSFDSRRDGTRCVYGYWHKEAV